MQGKSSLKFMVDLLGNSISNLTGIGTGITMKIKIQFKISKKNS